MTLPEPQTLSAHPHDPTPRGYFGKYGGRFVPETLIPALDELTAAYYALRDDPAFRAELADLARTYVGARRRSAMPAA